MLTQLTTLKARLAIASTDTQYDDLLTNAIRAVSDRFDRECRRTFARTVNATYEFDSDDTELLPSCYPIESVTRFETKSSESTGWQELIPAPDYLIRRSCIISLLSPLHTPHSALRILYTGGYVLPGDNLQPSTCNFQLPADLEQAALEQVVFWFANRDRVGVIREWPKGGLYQQFADIDLLPSVRATLAKYARVLW